INTLSQSPKVYNLSHFSHARISTQWERSAPKSVCYCLLEKLLKDLDGDFRMGRYPFPSRTIIFFSLLKHSAKNQYYTQTSGSGYPLIRRCSPEKGYRIPKAFL